MWRGDLPSRGGSPGSAPTRSADTCVLSVRRAVIALGLAALPIGLAMPAYANTGATTATITVTAGALTITVPTAANPLATGVSSVNGSVISGSLGQVEVNNARSAAAGSGWIATVASTALTPPSGPSIGAAALGYVVGAINQIRTATYTADDPTSLAGVVAAFTATGITGDNQATWNPTITITLLGSTAANTYHGTLTQSVS